MASRPAPGMRAPRPATPAATPAPAAAPAPAPPADPPVRVRVELADGRVVIYAEHERVKIKGANHGECEACQLFPDWLITVDGRESAIKSVGYA